MVASTGSNNAPNNVRLPVVLKHVACMVLTELAMSLTSPALVTTTPAASQVLGGRILAPASRQAAWLDLEAPRPRPITQLGAPAYVTDVSAVPGAPMAVPARARPVVHQKPHRHEPPRARPHHGA